MPPRNRFLARPAYTPGQQFVNTPQYPEIKVPIFQGGLNSEDDPTDIADDAFVQADNIILRNSRVTRISGRSLVTPARPNNLPVTSLVSLQEFSGNLIQLRITAQTIHRRTSVSWVQIDPATTPFSLAPNNIVSVDNRHFFSTQGNMPIQEIDLTTDEYLGLGNAPRYRFITAFGDRLIGLWNETIGSPVEVGWCGNLNYDEWDPLVDPSAGSVPLVESQSDYADFSTGIYGFADKLLILKERSVWLASKTGAGTNPFYFYVTSPSFGCDTPTSVQKVPNGIVYYDRRTNNVYTFDVNNPTPVPIGDNVRDEIQLAITTPDSVFSAFDSVQLEYHIGVISSETSVVNIWTYSFRNQGWWKEVTNGVSCVSSLNFAIPTTLIQDLAGNIVSLAGTISSLGTSGYPTPTNFYGMANGDIEIPDDTVSTGYTTNLRSKTWVAPQNNDFFVQRMTFTYEVLATGSFTISYSKDNGLTYATYKTVTLNNADIGKRLIVNCVKPVKARQFNWFIASTTGRFSIVDFKALTAPSGLSND
jgi:hypothetical protein